MKTELEKYGDYIQKNYNNILDFTTFITNNKEKGEELLHETLTSIFSRKTPFPKDIIEKNNEWLYTYVSIRRMAFNPNSPYHKLNINYNKPMDSDNNNIDELINDNLMVYMDENLEQFKYENIKELIDIEIENKNLYWYDGTLFLMFYYPSYYFNIDDIPKTISYRQLQKLTGINYQAIRLAILRATKKIKEILNKKQY